MSPSWQWVKANPDAAARKIRELGRENIALRADKDRLDWLEKQCVFMNLEHSPGVYSRFLTTRDEIDAARKEAQPCQS
jgi:hypothetical protein